MSGHKLLEAGRVTEGCCSLAGFCQRQDSWPGYLRAVEWSVAIFIPDMTQRVFNWLTLIQLVDKVKMDKLTEDQSFWKNYGVLKVLSWMDVWVLHCSLLVNKMFICKLHIYHKIIHVNYIFSTVSVCIFLYFFSHRFNASLLGYLLI